MNSGLPSIIIIDDDQRELDNIQDAFFKSGIPCLPIQYVKDDPDNESGIDHINISEWASPRIIVSDLNLTEVQNPKAVNLAGPLAKTLQKLSLKGPYLLCIWSKLESDVEDVMQILENRYVDDLTLPIQVSVISKTKFLDDPQKLKERLKELISENSLFDILLNWEFRMSEAARSAISALHSVAMDNAERKSIADQASELRRVLATIGNEAIGWKNAATHPSLAMDYGLIPVLEDQVRSLSSIDLDDKWRNAVPEIGTRQDLSNPVKSKLNTFYHVEEVPTEHPKDSRGVFVALNEAYLSESENKKKFERRIGRSIKNLIHDEFLPKNSEPADKEFRERARAGIILGFLEVSPACDYAQRKTKFPRYILGALIPEDFEELASWSPRPGVIADKAHEGVHRLPRIDYEGKTYIVKFSFKYQLGAQPGDNQWFGSSLFRVRDQILSAITFNCSQYASRPGIISFF